MRSGSQAPEDTVRSHLAPQDVNRLPRHELVLLVDKLIVALERSTLDAAAHRAASEKHLAREIARFGLERDANKAALSRLRSELTAIIQQHDDVVHDDIAVAPPPSASDTAEDTRATVAREAAVPQTRVGDLQRALVAARLDLANANADHDHRLATMQADHAQTQCGLESQLALASSEARLAALDASTLRSRLHEVRLRCTALEAEVLALRGEAGRAHAALATVTADASAILREERIHSAMWRALSQCEGAPESPSALSKALAFIAALSSPHSLRLLPVSCRATALSNLRESTMDRVPDATNADSTNAQDAAAAVTSGGDLTGSVLSAARDTHAVDELALDPHAWGEWDARLHQMRRKPGLRPSEGNKVPSACAEPSSASPVAPPAQLLPRMAMPLSQFLSVASCPGPIAVESTDEAPVEAPLRRCSSAPDAPQSPAVDIVAATKAPTTRGVWTSFAKFLRIDSPSEQPSRANPMDAASVVSRGPFASEAAIDLPTAASSGALPSSVLTSNNGPPRHLSALPGGAAWAMTTFFSARPPSSNVPEESASPAPPPLSSPVAPVVALSCGSQPLPPVDGLSSPPPASGAGLAGTTMSPSGSPSATSGLGDASGTRILQFQPVNYRLRGSTSDSVGEFAVDTRLLRSTTPREEALSLDIGASASPLPSAVSSAKPSAVSLHDRPKTLWALQSKLFVGAPATIKKPLPERLRSRRQRSVPRALHRVSQAPLAASTEQLPWVSAAARALEAVPLFASLNLFERNVLLGVFRRCTLFAGERVPFPVGTLDRGCSRDVVCVVLTGAVCVYSRVDAIERPNRLALPVTTLLPASVLTLRYTGQGSVTAASRDDCTCVLLISLMALRRALRWLYRSRLLVEDVNSLLPSIGATGRGVARLREALAKCDGRSSLCAALRRWQPALMALQLTNALANSELGSSEQFLRDLIREPCLIVNGEEVALGSSSRVESCVRLLSYTVTSALSMSGQPPAEAHALVNRILAATSRTITGGDAFTQLQSVLLANLPPSVSAGVFIAAEPSVQPPSEVFVHRSQVELRSVNVFRLCHASDSSRHPRGIASRGTAPTTIFGWRDPSKLRRDVDVTRALRAAASSPSLDDGVQVWALLRCVTSQVFPLRHESTSAESVIPACPAVRYSAEVGRTNRSASSAILSVYVTVCE